MSVTLFSPGRLPGDKVTRLPLARLFLLASLLFINPLYAQELCYKKYGVKEGLPGLVVYHSLQDNQGFIWFATNRGVSRFDGKFFKTYTKEDGLPDNEILKLYKDRHGNIWFISFLGIPSVFYKDSIHQIDCKGVFYIVEDTVEGYINLLAKQVKNGMQRLGFYQSPNTPRKWNFTPYFYGVNGITYTYWPILRATAPTGVRFYYSFIDKNINSLVVKKGKTKRDFLFGDTVFNPFSASSFIDIVSSKKGIVFTTVDSIYYADENGVRPLIHLKSLGLNAHRNTEVNFIFCENDSVIWLCTTNKGLIRIENFMHSSTGVQYFFSKNGCSSILKDGEGGYWITTLDDGVYYVPNLFFFNLNNQPEFTAGAVKCIRKIGPQQLAVGFGNGTIMMLNPENLDTRILSKWASGNKNNRILDIWPYWNNRLVIGSDRGLYMLSPEQESTELIYDIGIKGVAVKPDSTILSGSAMYTKLLDLNKKTQKLIYGDRVTCLATIGKNYFLGTLKGMYAVMGDSIIRFGERHRILNGMINHIDVAPDSALWISTPEGIVILKEEVAYIINKNRRLLSNQCKHVLFDSLTAWISTDQGISRVDYQWKGDRLSFRISNIMEVDGLQSSDVNQTATGGNYIWAATETGISYFCKSYTGSPYTLPPVRISRILSRSAELPLSDTIYITYKKSNLWVELFCQSYRSCGNIFYEYRLNDLDTTWHTTGNNYIEFSSIPSGEFILEVYAVNKWGQRTVSPKRLFIINRPPFWKSTWFSIVIYIITFLLVAVAFYIFNRIRHRGKEQSFKIIQKMRDLEIMALRAQMNPHFIFNCMSSIQYYILRNDAVNANLYLHKFSALIRKILQYSNVSALSTTEEIKLLELYLELEKMRFLEKMDFRIIKKGQLDADRQIIPPMIIQPYIENAIKHGISPLQDKKGIVTITFEQSAGYVHCIIDDNGIGINASRQRIRHVDEDHTSMGNSITEHRINIINSIRKNKILLKIFDKQELDPADTGTVVHLSFPVINE